MLCGRFIRSRRCDGPVIRRTTSTTTGVTKSEKMNVPTNPMRRWLPQIEALLDDDRNYLVVVGTLHFVGPDGLLDLLKRAGHKPIVLPERSPGAQR